MKVDICPPLVLHKSGGVERGGGGSGGGETQSVDTKIYIYIMRLIQFDILASQCHIGHHSAMPTDTYVT